MNLNTDDFHDGYRSGIAVARIAAAMAFQTGLGFTEAATQEFLATLDLELSAHEEPTETTIRAANLFWMGTRS